VLFPGSIFLLAGISSYPEVVTQCNRGAWSSEMLFLRTDAGEWAASYFFSPQPGELFLGARSE
jgi:3-mercaptopyruvate sulfurtransferase SseA